MLTTRERAFLAAVQAGLQGGLYDAGAVYLRTRRDACQIAARGVYAAIAFDRAPLENLPPIDPGKAARAFLDYACGVTPIPAWWAEWRERDGNREGTSDW